MKAKKGINGLDVRKKEDEFIAKSEFARRKKKLAEKRKEMKKKEREEQKSLHWMKCPKCGMDMIEIDFEGIKVDKCSSCLGVYFDDGEVADLVKKNKPGFLKRLKSVLGE